MSDFSIITEAKKVFDIEIEALQKTRDSLGAEFETLLSLLVNCKGKVIITGMGKPGHIGSKMAATLSSLGTSTFFMHPGEAMHGDLGMVTQNDVVLLLSYSGESSEITNLIFPLHEIGCTMVAVTGNRNSTLAKGCEYAFFFPPFEEACYMHLAPTSSTTALLVLGDALALVAGKMRNYTKDDYGLHHPAGALGKKLSVRVADIMHTEENNAVVQSGSSLRAAIIEMSTKGLSMVSVTDTDGHLIGIITDGDLRRLLERGVDVYSETVDTIMTASPKWIDSREMAVNALQKMSDLRITSMPVLDTEGKIVGSILMQDIYRAGIVK